MTDSDYFSQSHSRHNNRASQSDRLSGRFDNIDTNTSHSRPADSWIEIGSGASSSLASPDEIIITGLRIQQSRTHPRNRIHPTSQHIISNLDTRSPSVGGSSQDEYEESESESDRVMTSSNEGLALPTVVADPPTNPLSDLSLSTSMPESEGATTVGIGISTTSECFTPQPNAFTHPPSSSVRSQKEQTSLSSTPIPNSRYHTHRHSYPSDIHQERDSSRHRITADHSLDSHDAALRASLSTLLSCAAAARGLPKSVRYGISPSGTGTARKAEPMTLRIVEEATILEEGASATVVAAPAEQSGLPHPRHVSGSVNIGPAFPMGPITSAAEKGKRKAGVRSGSKERRIAKKLRQVGGSEDAGTVTTPGVTISPTLLTWVVSAGVLVAVSVVGFSAGYALGREKGWVEGVEWASSGTGLNETEARSCAAEAFRRSGSGLGLRRLRWRDAAGAVGVRV